MKIHELAKKTGLTAPTIRFYEQEGLLDARHVRRTENNYRDYCEEAIEHLLMMKEVQAAGFTLAEFKELDAACNTDRVGSSRARRRNSQHVLWIWPAIDPCTKILPVLSLGPRTQNAAPGCIPLFTSDGLNLYFSALTVHFGHWHTMSRRGRQVKQ